MGPREHDRQLNPGALHARRRGGRSVDPAFEDVLVVHFGGDLRLVEPPALIDSPNSTIYQTETAALIKPSGGDVGIGCNDHQPGAADTARRGVDRFDQGRSDTDPLLGARDCQDLAYISGLVPCEESDAPAASCGDQQAAVTDVELSSAVHLVFAAERRSSGRHQPAMIRPRAVPNHGHAHRRNLRVAESLGKPRVARSRKSVDVTTTTMLRQFCQTFQLRTAGATPR